MPTALFKDFFLRKANKADLSAAITDRVAHSKPPSDSVYVLDGGTLLHRVKWKAKATYSEVAHQYVGYVANKYGQNCCVVFDGYGQRPNTKSHEHRRRAVNVCADIRLTDTMTAHKNQERFLSNENNKMQFIRLLSTLLRAGGHTVNCSSGDADTLIVESAIKLSSQGNSVVIAADDTDVLVLSVHHWNHTSADVYFQSQARKSHRGGEAWTIADIIPKIGETTRRHLLFIHAWSGCDVTSATFGHGKTQLLKRLEKSREIQKISATMHDSAVSQAEIGRIGAELFVMLYSGKQSDTLNGLRYSKFMTMVTSSKTGIEPQKLPPTERAAYFHSLRVHLQTVEWKQLDIDILDPQKWGWEILENELIPVMTDLDAAPEALLKFIRCKCKMTSKHPCGTNICSCRKNAIKCVSACGDCRGENCLNSEPVEIGDETGDSRVP